MDKIKLEANEYAKQKGCKRVPSKAYSEQRSSAKRRGIEFNISFDEWWALWKEKFHLRGTGKMDLVMCRTLDSGGYTAGNVRIDLACTNLHEKKFSRFARSQGGSFVRCEKRFDMMDNSE